MYVGTRGKAPGKWSFSRVFYVITLLARRHGGAGTLPATFGHFLVKSLSPASASRVDGEISGPRGLFFRRAAWGQGARPPTPILLKNS